jgi:CheY-like chemotaxis protein
MKNCKSILLVEDDEAIREEVQDILETEGYTVTTAVNGREALQYLEQSSPEDLPGCILLDLMMPVMTGRELLDEIFREGREHLALIPVIVATAKGSPKVDLHDLETHIARIRKPFDIDQLIEMVKSHCGEPG